MIFKKSNKFLINNIISIYSLFYISLTIFYYKKIKKKKIIFFYHPKIRLVKNSISYVENYFSKVNDFYVIYGCKILIKKKNFYLINSSFLRFIIGADLFLSVQPSENFTYGSKKIYMHHSIHDEPLVVKKKEKELALILSKYDDIIVSSELVKKLFQSLFKKNVKTKISVFRYMKINYAIKKIKKRYSTNIKTILIAPTNYLSEPKITIQKKIKDIIYLLLKKNYKIIYRPHPSNLSDKKIDKIKRNFQNNKKFIFDSKPDYYKSFEKSDLMVTDLSGSAYMYVVTSSKPAIFFSLNEKYLKSIGYSKLSYFKDRKKIGYIVKSNKDLIKILNFKNIIKHKKNEIKNFKSSFFSSNDINFNYFL